MKRCKHCERELPFEAFAISRKAPDGLQAWCRGCKSERAAERWRNMTDECKAAYYAARAKRRPRYRQKEDEYNKAWHAANPEKSRIYAARQRAKPERKEYHAAYWKEWRAANIEKAREYARRGQHKRRARMYAAGYERIDHAVVFERDEGICGICGVAVDPKNWHLDHIQSIALGGAHLYENVRVTHPKCNMDRSRATRDAKARVERERTQLSFFSEYEEVA